MNWLDPLIQEVNKYWALTGMAFNLAKVPPLLKNAGVNIELHLAGRKLRDAIREDASTDLRLVKSDLTWGAVPREVEIPADVKELFVATTKVAGKNETVRFGRGVWSAFSKPLKEGMRRFLDIGPPSKVYDLYVEDPLPPGGVEVPEEYIYNPSSELLPSEDRDQAIEIKIRSWASFRGIDIADLSLGKGRSDDRKTDGVAGSLTDFLDLSRLSSAEKARIQLPLDLLDKIRFGR
ncbi:hypothetical protein [Pararhizobium sp.]|uniref:hypothetical protein n=1 Tax=Pararhizobium sp. TaxID=1977563 RepID=UPI003D10406F